MLCESRANNEVQKAADVVSVKSSHSKGCTVIEFKTELDIDKISKAIASIGYGVGEVMEEEYEKKGLFSRFKKIISEELFEIMKEYKAKNLNNYWVRKLCAYVE